MGTRSGAYPNVFFRFLSFTPDFTFFGLVQIPSTSAQLAFLVFILECTQIRDTVLLYNLMCSLLLFLVWAPDASRWLHLSLSLHLYHCAFSGKGVMVLDPVTVYLVMCLSICRPVLV